MAEYRPHNSAEQSSESKQKGKAPKFWSFWNAPTSYLKLLNPHQVTRVFTLWDSVWHNTTQLSPPTQHLLGLGFNGSSSKQKLSNCFSSFTSFLISLHTQKPQQGLEPEKCFCSSKWAQEGLLLRWIEVEAWEQKQRNIYSMWCGGCRERSHRYARWKIRVPSRGASLSLFR